MKHIITIISTLLSLLILSTAVFGLEVRSETEVYYTPQETLEIEKANTFNENYIRTLSPRIGGQRTLNISPIEQIDGTHCGPACAVMAANYLGLTDSNGNNFTQRTIESVINYDGATYTGDIAIGMNRLLGENIYQLVNTQGIPGAPKAGMWSSIVTSINGGYPVFVSIKDLPNYDTPVAYGHIILTVGYYYTSTASRVTYNDSRQGYVGQHTITGAEMESACNTRNGNFVRANLS